MLVDLRMQLFSCSTADRWQQIANDRVGDRRGSRDATEAWLPRGDVQAGVNVVAGIDVFVEQDTLI